ncbi:MAG: UDP-2,3-diacylglucosamine diphosphatase [Chitinophagales bacterium]
MSIELPLQAGKKIYFISDLHLGAPDSVASSEREKKLARFLDAAKSDAQAVFLVGDTFDFWFEYKLAVPKGFVRFLSKLQQLTDAGIAVYIFIGNHDLWMRDYLEKETGARIFFDKTTLVSQGKSMLLAHGDGLGPGDTKYKILKKIFTNKLCQWLFRWLHPDIGIKIAQLWSRHTFTDPAIEVFHGEEKEWLIQYCKRKLTEQRFDYFIMGHRHLPMEIKLNENSTYINLGDWIINCNYAVFDGNDVKLNKFI